MSYAINDLGGTDMTALYQSLFKKLDSDGDSSISKSEFENSVSSLNTGSSGTSDTDSLFSRLDADGSGVVDETELMDALKQAGEQTRANMPPPPPPQGSHRGQDVGDSSLTDDQKQTVDSILSQYDASSLTSSDVKAINQAFRDAGISFGKGLGDEVESQGFSIDTMMSLDPLNRDGSDASSSTVNATDVTSSTASTSSTTSTASESDSASTTPTDDSLLAGLIQYLNSTSSSGSTSDESELLQRVKSSTGLSDDQINSLFDSFLSTLANQAQYNQSGSIDYALGSANLFSVAA